MKVQKFSAKLFHGAQDDNVVGDCSIIAQAAHGSLCGDSSVRGYRTG